MDGEVHLLSQTGPFSLPVRFLTKKCLVSLDKDKFDFGNVYLGETFRHHINVYNAGALTAEYIVSAVLDDAPPIAPIPPIQEAQETHTVTTTQPPTVQEAAVDLTPVVSRGVLSERSNYSIMSNIEIFRHRDGSATALGVIPADSVSHKLKSKSMGHINFQGRHEEGEGLEGGMVKGDNDPEKKETKKLRQLSSPRAESMSAPGGSRSEIHPLPVTPTHDVKKTPSISLQEDAGDLVAAQQPPDEQGPSISADTSTKVVDTGQSSLAPTRCV